MARKRKYPKLPNGFGSIKKLSGNRSNPYAVYPPTEEFAPNSVPLTPKALCYVRDWYTGFYALMEYKNGTFDAEKFQSPEVSESSKDDDIIKSIIASYNNTKRAAEQVLTFAQVYELYYKDKFENPKKKFSKSTAKNYQWAYKQCTSLYERPMKSIVTKDMQAILDACTLSYSSVNSIRNLFGQMFDYAIINGIVSTNYAQYTAIHTEKVFENGEPFTEEEIKMLWKNKSNPDVQIILILIYTGMRIGELQITNINYENNCFEGGLKTPAGRDRIIPFPDSIKDFIKNFNQSKFNANTFRDDKFYPLIQSVGMPPLTNGKKHTPHDCRHTFSWLCDKYKVDDLSKHLLMGHSLGSDVEKSVYGHRNINQLREEINKIEVPVVTNVSLTNTN